LILIILINIIFIKIINKDNKMTTSVQNIRHHAPCAICGSAKPVNPTRLGFQTINHNSASQSLDSKITIVCQDVFCASCIGERVSFEKDSKEDHYCPVCQKKYTILISKDLKSQFNSITIPLGKNLI
jgi:Zn finger protein HypA/HybF involved in hydrogenase expression